MHGFVGDAPMGLVPNGNAFIDEQELRRFMPNSGASLEVVCQVLLPTDIDRHDIEFGSCNLPSCEGADRTIRIVEKHHSRMFDRGREHIIEIDFFESFGLH